MDDVNLPEWNRTLVEQTIAILESHQSTTEDAISRLRGMLAVNRGGVAVVARDEMGEDAETSGAGP